MSRSSRAPHHPLTPRRTGRVPGNHALSRLFAAFSVALLAGMLALPGATPARQATPAATTEQPAGASLDAAVAWLLAQQDPNGGFLGFSGEPDAGVTTDAVLALYAVHDANPETAAALDAAVAWLEEQGADYANTGAGQAAKLAMAAVAGGRDPRNFGGVDLVAAIAAPPTTSVQNPISGIYGDDLYDHALALMALAAAGEPVGEEAIEPLRATQTDAGGWAFDGSAETSAADSNTTALVIQALVATGHGDDPMVANGLAFLQTLLAPDGSGVAYGPADPLIADANSTALALQAVIAAGEDPASGARGNLPRALVAFQTPEGGLRYMAGDEEPNLLATLQGIPALAGAPLPVATACAADEASETNACIPLAPAA